MAFRRRKTFKRKSFKKRTFKKRVAKLTKPVKRTIQRMISRNVENKTAQVYNYERELWPVTSVNFPTQNIFPLGPDPTSIVIVQGVGQGQRIGNTIKTKKLVIRGTVVPYPYDAVFNPAPGPIQVKMWVFYDKRTPVDVPNPVAGSNFFQSGNTSKGFQNDLADLWSPVNSDIYRILATRTFKLGNAEYAGTSPPVSTASAQYYTNNDFKYNANFSINLTKHYPKTVKFNDNTSTPSSRGLFMMVAFFNANGTQINSGYRAVGMQYMQDYHYEDA